MDDIFTREMIVPSIIIAIVTAAIVIFVFLMLEKSRAKKGMSKIKNAEDEADKIIEDANKKAIEMACLGDYIKKLPLGIETKIGTDGTGVSGGEKQRIMIARAIYKNPLYLLLDEATSSLDAENERNITENLSREFHGRTMLVIAHRLSTVRDADNIIVLRHGKVVETGNHKELVGRKGYYYELVKNQLELAKE